MEEIKVKLPKEVYDFLKGQSLIIECYKDGTLKTYMHLPHVFEVVSDGYNLVIEHYNDKLLPDDVKEAIIATAVCKEHKNNLEL